MADKLVLENFQVIFVPLEALAAVHAEYFDLRQGDFFVSEQDRKDLERERIFGKTIRRRGH